MTESDDKSVIRVGVVGVCFAAFGASVLLGPGGGFLVFGCALFVTAIVESGRR